MDEYLKETDSSSLFNVSTCSCEIARNHSVVNIQISPGNTWCFASETSTENERTYVVLKTPMEQKSGKTSRAWQENQCSTELELCSGGELLYHILDPRWICFA